MMHLRLLLAAACVLATAAAPGADVHWNAGTADWNVGSNWDTGYVPGTSDSADVARVDNSGTPTIDTTVPDIGRLFVGYGGGTSGYLEVLDGGSLTVATTATSSYIGGYGNGYLTVGDGGTFEIADNTNSGVIFGSGGSGIGYGTQTGGTVDVDYYVYLSWSGEGYYDMSGGSLTTRRLLVGLRGTGEFTQTGDSSVTASSELTLAWYRDGHGTYTVSGGTVSANQLENGNHLTNDDHGGTGLLRVVADGATINANSYFQNRLSKLETLVGNGGISTIEVAGTTTIETDAELHVGLYGGVALTTTTAFDLLERNSGGNISGTLTSVDTSTLWDITQGGTVVQASFAAPGQGSVAAGYHGPTEVAVNGGAGAAADWLTVTGMNVSQPIWALFDVAKAGGVDLTPTELTDLADYIDGDDTLASVGHRVYTSHPALFGGYDFLVEFVPVADTSYLAWDFTDYTTVPGLLVRNVAVGVPEPASLLLIGAALGCLLLRRGRRRR